MLNHDKSPRSQPSTRSGSLQTRYAFPSPSLQQLLSPLSFLRAPSKNDEKGYRPNLASSSLDPSSSQPNITSPLILELWDGLQALHCSLAARIGNGVHLATAPDPRFPFGQLHTDSPAPPSFADMDASKPLLDAPSLSAQIETLRLWDRRGDEDEATSARVLVCSLLLSLELGFDFRSWSLRRVDEIGSDHLPSSGCPCSKHKLEME